MAEEVQEELGSAGEAKRHDRRPALRLDGAETKGGDGAMEGVSPMGVMVVEAVPKKPYLGGYRHKLSGSVYLHATTQTPRAPRRDWEGKPPKLHRDTQTVVEKTRSQQSKRESGTQMARKDLFLDDRLDREVAPRPYFSAAQLEELKLRKTVVIQCYWRGYVARKRVGAMRAALEQQRRQLREAEARQSEAEAQRQQREVERRMKPRSYEDFEVLYNELETWRYQETQRINSSGLSREERLAALAQLLHKETKLLQTIDRLKQTATSENKSKRIQEMLETMSAPKQWATSDGEVASVHTPFTVRAKELAELYSGLTMPMLSVDERLEVLLHVKWTVKEFDCALTRDTVELIDREADLLNRGRGERSLQGLRKRLANMFLQFIETPEFNPESARFQRVPQEFLLRPDVAPIHSAKHPAL